MNFDYFLIQITNVFPIKFAKAMNEKKCSILFHSYTMQIGYYVILNIIVKFIFL